MVEHDRTMMNCCDFVVEMGPAAAKRAGKSSPPRASRVPGGFAVADGLVIFVGKRLFRRLVAPPREPANH